MKELKARIMSDGKVKGEGILKVDTFLNHQIDVGLLDRVGKTFFDHFKNEKITKIVTIEASGIAIGMSVAREFGLPLVFAKKTLSKNIDGEIYSTKVESYTKGTIYTICIAKKFLNSEDRVLVVDDFLANGSALLGLKSIIEESGAELSGAGIVIEKSFQSGIQRCLDAGINVYSLARIASIRDGQVTFVEE